MISDVSDHGVTNGYYKKYYQYNQFRYRHLYAICSDIPDLRNQNNNHKRRTYNKQKHIFFKCFSESEMRTVYNSSRHSTTWTFEMSKFMKYTRNSDVSKSAYKHINYAKYKYCNQIFYKNISSSHVALRIIIFDIFFIVHFLTHFIEYSKDTHLFPL